MTSTQFKLTKPGGLTRRIHFDGKELPSWSALASKIESLFEIPIEKIGVAYLDSDGDEVTLSSEDELQDFYTAVHTPSKTIKFVVQDLGSLRDSQHPSSKAESVTPQNTHYRNTFGGEDAVPMAFEVEDDWQRLPHGLGGLFGRNTSDSDGFYGAPDSPHAFIEVLDSDVNSVIKDNENSPETTMEESDLLSSLATPIMNKGKGKARAEMQPSSSDDISSTGSILVAEEPVKYPVHVLDVGDEGMAEPVRIETSPPRQSVNSPVVSIQAESTPVAIQTNLPTEMAKGDISTGAADPPLPSLDSERPAPSVSLTSDVATFLTSLSEVFSSHPELSEGLRNITRNAANGTYWSAHREAVSRAAEELRRSTTSESGRAAGELRRVAEEEAGRRVAAALGGLMRLFGDMTIGGNGESRLQGAPPANGGPDASNQPTTVDYEDINSTSSVPPPGTSGGTPPLGRPFSWGVQNTFAPPPGAPPPPGPPPPSGHPPHRHHGPFGTMPLRPPPPPHFQHPGPFGPPLGPPHRAHWGSPFWARPPPPGGRRGTPPSFMPWAPTGPNQLTTPVDAVSPWADPSSATTPSPAELRAKVEAAKQTYKREKEMYRRARDERKAADRKAAEQTQRTAAETYVISLQSLILRLTTQSTVQICSRWYQECEPE